ncbi:MAG: helix-turn-helix domain-containing protein [Candidatus Moraniibacteriota bacterium]
MTEINPKEVYTTKEAQDFLKISESTIKRLLKSGIITAYKVGGTYRIWGDEILRLLSPKAERKIYNAYKELRSKAKEAIKKW